MADPTLPELLKEKTKEDFFDELVDAAIAEGIPETAWQSGEPLRHVMAFTARVLAIMWALVLPALRAPFLDFATGAWLTLLAWSFYGVKRKGATFGQASIPVENRGGSLAVIPVGSVRIKNSATSKTFTNTTGGSIAAWSGSGAYPSTSLTFRADEAGSGSDTFAGEIAATPVTAPSNVFVKTTPTATPAILGSDEEDDAALRVRAKASQGPLSPAGPKDAYRFAALSTTRPDGTYVDVTRVRVIDWGNSELRMFLAGSSGPAGGSMVEGTSDVFYVYANLLKTVLPTGQVLKVYAATDADIIEPTLTYTYIVNLSLYVDIDSGLTKAEAERAATDALTRYIAAFPIGGQRKVEAGDPQEAGRLFWSEVCAKASESAEGIIAADYTVTFTDPGDPLVALDPQPDPLPAKPDDVEIAYSALPSAIVSAGGGAAGNIIVTAFLVKQQ